MGLANDCIGFPVFHLASRRMARMDFFQTGHLAPGLYYVVFQLPSSADQELLGQLEQTKCSITVDARYTDGKWFLMRFPVAPDNAFGRPAQLEFGQNIVDVFLIDRASTAAVFPLEIVVSLRQKSVKSMGRFRLK